MWAAISLWRQAKRARPQSYVTKKSVAQSYASRTMRWGGVIIALFIIYHILDLTFGAANPDGTGLDALRPPGRQLPRTRPPRRLRRRADPARPAPAARDLERHPDPRSEQPAPGAQRQRLRDRLRHPPHRRLPRRAGRRRLRARGLRTERTHSCHRTVHRRRADRRHQGPERRRDRRALGRAHASAAKLVNPANRRKLTVIVVGTGLAGGSAAATLGEPGYNVTASATRTARAAPTAIAAQGGINAAKNYRNDGDSVVPALLRHGQGRRLPRARVQRLPPGRGQRQHHRPVRRPGRALRPRVRRPARQPLVRRRPGVAHLLRPRPDGPAAAARRLPGARAADRGRQRRACTPRTEMLDLVVVDGRARGIVARDLVTGEISTHFGRRGRAGHRRLRQRLLPVDQRHGLQRHGHLAGAPARARSSPTPATRRSTRPASRVSGDHQSKLTLMSESLRNDGRIWVPKDQGRHPPARATSPRTSATTTWSASTPRFGNLVPRDIASRAAKHVCDEGRGVGPGGRASTSTSPTPSSGWARPAIAGEYGNLFEMYERITGEDPYKTPMRIYPAVALHDGRAVGRLRPA